MSTRDRIVITGASGFLGSRLLERLVPSHDIVAIDRRSRPARGAGSTGNVDWHQIEISDAEAVARTFRAIRSSGGASHVIHLAAYYDFADEDHPEYRRTNVDGTRILLDAAQHLDVSRFVFASSIAACPFSSPGKPIVETTPPAGKHIYAITKRAGEEMVRASSAKMSCTIVRFAALFSDWCEYPPLFLFLDTWLSNRWNARILGGRGDAAIPFLHVKDALRCVERVLSRERVGERLEVVTASPDGAVSHAELFMAATQQYFGQERRAIHVPKPLAGLGIRARDLLGRIRGRRPFERPWMIDYIDRRMDVDASATRALLDWRPEPRRAILARIPFLVENFKNARVSWNARNQEALHHLELRPSFQVYRLLERHEHAIADRFLREHAGYRAQDIEARRWDQRLLASHLLQAVRAGEKLSFMTYCHDVAIHRRLQGVTSATVIRGLRILEAISREAVLSDPEGGHLEDATCDHITMTVEFGIDQVLEAYEDG